MSVLEADAEAIVQAEEVLDSGDNRLSAIVWIDTNSQWETSAMLRAWKLLGW